MRYIWIRSPRHHHVPTGPVVNVRCDLPFRASLDLALIKFEVAYVEQLVRRHASLASAARAAGITVDELIAMIVRHSQAGLTSELSTASWGDAA